ncbi:MAG: hypothetical protein KKD99_09410 [Proteobacteria bacterium]|nr:hypothetical protein [Pseudomonadota bacterium]MBU4448793.1 hypothetical protein [Pseudomonadota bacterium]MCG2772734.1 hypothetical protein [Desulfobacterales bacterium]
MVSSSTGFLSSPQAGPATVLGSIISLAARDFFADSPAHQAAHRPQTIPGTGEITWTQR